MLCREKQEEYMALALELAREAASQGEVPVGCVIADAERSCDRPGRKPSYRVLRRYRSR